MNDEYLSFQLAMGDQLMDLQKNGNTYTRMVKNNIEVEVGKIYLEAYRNVLNLITRIKENPDIRLTCYNGQWYTKEEIDKILHNDIFNENEIR